MNIRMTTPVFEGPGQAGSMPIGVVLRTLLIVCLVAVLVTEAFYLVKLRETIDRQSEDLRDISLQLQAMKTDRANLHQELSSMQKNAGEKNNGNAADRQY